jgi:hypothetical protein
MTGLFFRLCFFTLSSLCDSALRRRSVIDDVSARFRDVMEESSPSWERKMKIVEDLVSDTEIGNSLKLSVDRQIQSQNVSMRAVEDLGKFSKFVHMDPLCGSTLKTLRDFLNSDTTRGRIFGNSSEIRTEELIFNARSEVEPFRNRLASLLQRAQTKMSRSGSAVTRKNDERAEIDFMFAPRFVVNLLRINSKSQYVMLRFTGKIIWVVTPVERFEWGMDIRVESGNPFVSNEPRCLALRCVSYAFVDRLYSSIANTYSHTEKRSAEKMGASEEDDCTDGGPTCFYPVNDQPRFDQVGIGFYRDYRLKPDDMDKPNAAQVSFFLVFRMGWDVPAMHWMCSLNYASGVNLMEAGNSSEAYEEENKDAFEANATLKQQYDLKAAAWQKQIDADRAAMTENDMSWSDADISQSHIWEFRIICQGNNWFSWSMYWSTFFRGAEVGEVFAKRRKPDPEVDLDE